MNFYKTLGLISLSCLFLGCTPIIKDTTNKTINILSNPEDVISVSISYAPSVNKSSNLKESINELNESITSSMHNQLPNMFVTSNQTKSGLSVDITVEKFRYVSGFGRFMAGVMVGDAILKLNVKIKDIKSGSLIRNSTLDTTSEFSNGIFGATTSRQIEAMADKISKYIKSAKNS